MWKLLNGWLQLEITCADGISLLNALNSANVYMENVTFQDDLTIHITLSKIHYKYFVDICAKHGASVKIIKKSGFPWTILSMMKRPVLIIFGVILLILYCLLPSRVLFISVEGNHSVDTNQILEAAEKCGICFGASRRQVRSEKMKNALLFELPELQWAGINTAGCTAIISVKEKTTQNISSDINNQVSSIVAVRDGIIQSCTVYQGNSLCSVGQAVKSGQILVSGYQDCGIITKASQADAEIKALTFREIEVIAPTATAAKGNIRETKTVYSIRIGKNIIKLCKDSGNLHVICDKIYVENYMQLPGGFQLPISIIKEVFTGYEEISDQVTNASNQNWVAEYANRYLQDTMVAGEILSGQTDIESFNDYFYLFGRYACVEMIGRVKYEQTMIGDR